MKGFSVAQPRPASLHRVGMRRPHDRDFHGMQSYTLKTANILLISVFAALIRYVGQGVDILLTQTSDKSGSGTLHMGLGLLTTIILFGAYMKMRNNPNEISAIVVLCLTVVIYGIRFLTNDRDSVPFVFIFLFILTTVRTSLLLCTVGALLIFSIFATILKNEYSSVRILTLKTTEVGYIAFGIIMYFLIVENGKLLYFFQCYPFVAFDYLPDMKEAEILASTKLSFDSAWGLVEEVALDPFTYIEKIEKTDLQPENYSDENELDDEINQDVNPVLVEEAEENLDRLNPLVFNSSNSRSSFKGPTSFLYRGNSASSTGTVSDMDNDEILPLIEFYPSYIHSNSVYVNNHLVRTMFPLKRATDHSNMKISRSMVLRRSGSSTTSPFNIMLSPLTGVVVSAPFRRFVSFSQRIYVWATINLFPAGVRIPLPTQTITTTFRDDTIERWYIMWLNSFSFLYYNSVCFLLSFLFILFFVLSFFSGSVGVLYDYDENIQPTMGVSEIALNSIMLSIITPVVIAICYKWYRSTNTLKLQRRTNNESVNRSVFIHRLTVLVLIMIGVVYCLVADLKTCKRQTCIDRQKFQKRLIPMNLERTICFSIPITLTLHCRGIVVLFFLLVIYVITHISVTVPCMLHVKQLTDNGECLEPLYSYKTLFAQSVWDPFVTYFLVFFLYIRPMDIARRRVFSEYILPYIMYVSYHTFLFFMDREYQQSTDANIAAIFADDTPQPVTVIGTLLLIAACAYIISRPSNTSVINRPSSENVGVFSFKTLTVSLLLLQKIVTGRDISSRLKSNAATGKSAGLTTRLVLSIYYICFILISFLPTVGRYQQLTPANACLKPTLGILSLTRLGELFVAHVYFSSSLIYGGLYLPGLLKASLSTIDHFEASDKLTAFLTIAGLALTLPVRIVLSSVCFYGIDAFVFALFFYIFLINPKEDPRSLQRQDCILPFTIELRWALAILVFGAYAGASNAQHFEADILVGLITGILLFIVIKPFTTTVQSLADISADNRNFRVLFWLLILYISVALLPFTCDYAGVSFGDMSSILRSFSSKSFTLNDIFEASNGIHHIFMIRLLKLLIFLAYSTKRVETLYLIAILTFISYMLLMNTTFWAYPSLGFVGGIVAIYKLVTLS